MSIVSLSRVTLAGLVGEKEEILGQLQERGCLHLIPLQAAPAAPEQAPSPHALGARQALRYLRDVPDKRRQVHDPEGFDLPATIERILANRQRRRDLRDRRDALRQRISELEPWGDFQLPDPEDLGGRKLWFYRVPQRHLHLLDTLDLPWQIVHRDHRQSWVVLISRDEPELSALPVARAHTGAVGLSEVRHLLERAELELEEVQEERHALTRWIYLLSSHLAGAEDRAGLRYAGQQTHDEESLFLVQGWAATGRLPEIETLAQERGLAFLAAPVGPGDTPPTLLANPPALSAGEDLVGFYQMPAYHSWDPSRVLFFSFALFFAMILSDAGYGLVFSALLGLLWKRLGHSDTGRRLRLLSAVLCATSVLWGVLVGSYFGMAPPEGGTLAALKVLSVDDFPTMMGISIGIGVVHLLLANAEMARVQRGTAAGRVARGWMAVLCGGCALALGSGDGAPALLHTLGIILLGGGLAGILLLGSDRPVKSPLSALLRLLDGLQQMTKITQVFGDVLSYLRLFALGLASASLALTFNDLARQILHEVPGPGLLFAILILVVGHTLNLALCLMSGVVHGLRLNFIEFYNWALSGEGYPFKPFKKTELSE